MKTTKIDYLVILVKQVGELKEFLDMTGDLGDSIERILARLSNAVNKAYEELRSELKKETEVRCEP